MIVNVAQSNSTAVIRRGSMDIAGIAFVAIIIASGVTFTTYIANRSRCTLEETAQRSGRSASELRELIQTGMLDYRRKYGLFGPQSLNVDEVSGDLAAAVDIKRMRTETDVTIRKMAEETATQIQEANRRYQEREAAHRAQMEVLNRIHAEILKSM